MTGRPLSANFAISCTPSADGGQPLPVLPLHKLVEGEEYLLGMFLGGVYQEVMGSSHNMLGSTHVVHVKASPGSLPAFGERLEPFTRSSANLCKAGSNPLELLPFDELHELFGLAGKPLTPPQKRKHP